ncbi:hypothetical protein F2Q68_00033750 [Brassica cretica]|uniref:Uncharacterized protein n=1 Tax=Brassica cretica TaxID=69181 RepID=A0A8S9HBF7_BRACR|nr:hypothetical protein F2Q68_00033750 [Brassica cretica]
MKNNTANVGGNEINEANYESQESVLIDTNLPFKNTRESMEEIKFLYEGAISEAKGVKN